MLVVQWTAVLFLTCARKCVMRILQWQVRVLIYVPVLVPMMRKDVVAAWIKSVSALFVHRSAPIVAVVNPREYSDTLSLEVLETRAGRT